ncbi:hypothetical protein QUF61_15370 [Candidatus Venteria ishoeyi]|uniref:hypothetical protein n=1 Tax=Candidatus Venteria ishoeyi TaxID=1899563 RepID=UPI0025A67C05|nr:hypothetical protein [Candidatus Venteria ishoeyi]MDM8547867.1 hypothetical protein [Candidatus Venteria ishoeyi]
MGKKVKKFILLFLSMVLSFSMHGFARALVNEGFENGTDSFLLNGNYFTSNKEPGNKKLLYRGDGLDLMSSAMWNAEDNNKFTYFNEVSVDTTWEAGNVSKGYGLVLHCDSGKKISFHLFKEGKVNITDVGDIEVAVRDAGNSLTIKKIMSKETFDFLGFEFYVNNEPVRLNNDETVLKVEDCSNVSLGIENHHQMDIKYDNFKVTCGEERISNSSGISWACNGAHTYYCTKVIDSSGNVLEEQQCGYGMHKYPLNDLNLGEDNYTWEVSSALKEGDELKVFDNGEFSVCTADLPYVSNSNQLQWGCRKTDASYCLDILDEEGKELYNPYVCNTGLHSINPQQLSLLPGQYQWRVWSNSAEGFPENIEEEFKGVFNVYEYTSTINNIEWRFGTEINEYCVDIFYNGSMLNEISNKTGEEYEHSKKCNIKPYKFSTAEYAMKRFKLSEEGLKNLKKQYSDFIVTWKIWSKNIDGTENYGGTGFEGAFKLGGDCVSVALKSPSAETLEWGCRSNHTYYCIDIIAAENTDNPSYAPVECGEGLHATDYSRLDLPAGDYTWKVWSGNDTDSAYGGPGFEGALNITE